MKNLPLSHRHRQLASGQVSLRLRRGEDGAGGGGVGHGIAGGAQRMAGTSPYGRLIDGYYCFKAGELHLFCAKILELV